MVKLKVKTKDQNSLLSQALLSYYDEFTDFNEDCAFLCDAFACLVDNHGILDQHSIRGLSRNAHWLKHRTNDFKERLKKIRELESE